MQTAKRSESIINLVFVQKELKVAECEIQEDLRHRSDYYPVATYINFSPDLEPEKVKNQAWESADSRFYHFSHLQYKRYQAYKARSIKILEAELEVMPLDVYLNQAMLKSRYNPRCDKNLDHTKKSIQQKL